MEQYMNIGSAATGASHLRKRLARPVGDGVARHGSIVVGAMFILASPHRLGLNRGSRIGQMTNLVKAARRPISRR
jgi:hypothetical protein